MRECAGLAPIRRIGLLQDVPDVRNYRVVRNYQLIGDITVAATRCDEPKHLDLPLGQAGRVGLRFNGYRLGEFEPSR